MGTLVGTMNRRIIDRCSVAGGGGLNKCGRIDAFTDATPAVSLYLKLGFRIESTFEDDDA